MLSTDPPPALASAAADADEALGRLIGGVDAGGLGELSHGGLTALLGSLRKLAARVDAVTFALVREVDTRGTHTEEGLLSAAAWLRARARMAPGEAARTVRTARGLGSRELAATAAALAAGDVDRAHVELIASAAAVAPSGAVALIEPEALATAREADPRSVASLMRRFAHALDPDDADAAALARFERRGLSYAPTLDGSLAGRMLADEVTGAVIATAVDEASPLVKGDSRSPAQRRMDGLADICRHYLACTAHADDVPAGRGHAQVIVTVDAATLAAEPADPGSPGATLSWVGDITASTARRVACDAAVTVVQLGPDGEAAAAEPARRFFSRAQRLAMIGRDGDRCCLPWCDRPVAWSDGHHILPWGQGGATSVDNGALPCTAHHVWLHEGRWELRRLPDGRYLIRHPDGRTIGPEPHPPGRNRPARPPPAHR